METILIIIAVIMALDFCTNTYFNATARQINTKRYNENKSRDEEVKELEDQLSLMNTTVLNSANELMRWKETALKLDAMVKEKNAEIDKLKEERDAVKTFNTSADDGMS